MNILFKCDCGEYRTASEDHSCQETREPREMAKESAASPHSTLVFSTRSGLPMLTLRSDGTITIRGEPVATNREAYLAFTRWLTEESAAAEVLRLRRVLTRIAEGSDAADECEGPRSLYELAKQMGGDARKALGVGDGR